MTELTTQVWRLSVFPLGPSRPPAAEMHWRLIDKRGLGLHSFSPRRMYFLPPSWVQRYRHLTHGTGNALYYSSPAPPKSNSPEVHHLIFFIPGNPGLISYYEPFLSTLYSSLLLNDKN